MKRITIFFILLSMAFTLDGCGHIYTDKNAGPIIKQTLSRKKFTSLTVNSAICDIELRSSKKYQIVYHGYKKLIPKIEKQNQTLTINQQMHFSSYNLHNDATITIYVPAKELKNLKLTSNDGDIDLYGSVHAKNIHLESNDGDITTDTVTADTVFLSSDDGDISVDQLLTKYGAQLNSSDGDIKVDKNNASGYHLSSDDGDVTFNGQDEDNDDDGGSYRSHLNSNNVLKVQSSDGGITIN